MNSLAAEILIVGGGAAGMAAALAAADRAQVTIVDDNPRLGGQIWRAELGLWKYPEAREPIGAITAGKIKVINNAQVCGASENKYLLAEIDNTSAQIQYEKLIIATGARERFLPFPGWTLPNVFGAGGLQALVKGGLPITNKRVVVAGTGPLLLAVADYLKAKGADIPAIVEQAPMTKLRSFAFGLWRFPGKMALALALRARLSGIPILTDAWVTSCGGDDRVR